MAKYLLLGFCALFGAAGCAVTFNDSAPASAGNRYVVGSKSNQPVVFLCPDQPGKECEVVDVEIK